MDNYHDSFIKTYCQHAKAIPYDAIRQFAIEAVTLDGVYVELGVHRGDTINKFASFIAPKNIHGFDSFEGLPEDWIGKRALIYPKGYFALNQLPNVLSNVVLHKGWFQNTLPQFMQEIQMAKPLAFLHIDCDLYSSTACALNTLAPLIVEETILLFDEIFNYQGYEDHELKALNEFLSKFAFKADYLAYAPDGMQAVVRLQKV